MFEHLDAFFLGIGAVAALVLLTLAIRHTDRFGKDRGPMPARTRNLLMWVILISGLALTAWELKHGNTLFYQ
jgi:hypothetical protein